MRFIIIFIDFGVRLEDHFYNEVNSFDTDDIYNNEFLNTYISLLKINIVKTIV